MMQKTANWFSDIAAYFRFVSSRRPDNAHNIVPSIITVYLLALSVIITLLIIYADPILLSWVREPDRQFPAVFQYITRLGKASWILAGTGVLLVMLSLFNAKRFKGQQNIVWHRLFLNVWFAFTSIAYSGLVVLMFKSIFGRARPQFTPEGHIWLFQPFEFGYNFASFPSGHSTTGGALAMVLILLFPRWRWFFGIAAIAIAVSRPVLGVHFPSDVVAGTAFGVGFVWIYARVFARKRLLFRFETDGRLQLRGEDKGKMHLLKSMMSDVVLPKKSAGS